MTATVPSASPPAPIRLRPGVTKTRVDAAVEAIIAAVTEGRFLPGDRLVEAEIARMLDFSRVPVREALRILESQGIVVSSPYKGMRLMNVDADRLRDVLAVRASLEKLAIGQAIERHVRLPLAAPRSQFTELERCARDGDVYGVARCDTGFHRALCALSENEVLMSMWETLALQLTVIFGLSSLGKSLPVIVAEHRRLLDVLESNNLAAIARELDTHIMEQFTEVDLGAEVEKRRQRLRALP